MFNKFCSFYYCSMNFCSLDMEPCFVRTCFDEEAATREDNNELGFATMARDLGTGCQTADHIAVWSPNNAK